jgi:HAD superfamily hydrolase (TIGR01509 family)
MSRAFIFDLDGVLIDDEKLWDDAKAKMYHDLFGDEVTARLGSTIGINLDGIYAAAVKAGAAVDQETFKKACYAAADNIYKTAPVTEGVADLAAELKQAGYRIGIVSASPLAWVTTVTKRLPFEDDIELIISLHERDDLEHKPAPDGYLEAIKVLGATPESTVILEDSNSGIKSAKASGAYTIGLKQNLTDGYEQQGADTYADNIDDVIKIVRERS